MAHSSKTKGWQRHFDGWQPGLFVVVLAALVLLLSLPRAAEPLRTPAPRIDDDALTATMRADEALARGAIEVALDVDVRALGRELRAYNEASLGDDEDAFAAARVRASDAANRAAAHPDDLRALRAFQMMRFLFEFASWRQTGVESAELGALSGDFIATMARNRWCVGSTRELFVTDDELRVLFKKRWNVVAGFVGADMALTVDEDRLRLGFLLEHPFHSEITSMTQDRGLTARVLMPQQLRTIERLAELDVDYPADLARGVVLYRTEQFAPATNAFRDHLELRPDGPYTLRARNYLKAALDRTQESL
ncbi:MAG: hypothetical protein EXR75_14085 [Myxococcales bacterium]|nr:hypothetical protein [Myxococcales bacterium]